MQITLISRDTGEVVFSMDTEDNNNVIVHKDYAVIDSPHDFTNIDGKLYVNTKYIINSEEAEDEQTPSKKET